MSMNSLVLYINEQNINKLLQYFSMRDCCEPNSKINKGRTLQKGVVPAAPSGTATLLRLSPNYQFCPRPLLYGYGLQAPPAFMA